MGVTGLLWLFLSYGYVLYQGANLISEGSELLLLVPSMAGLVGGVVLPLLGAVPDGAIILFSGLGDLQAAQETLSVGVGALAGSTVMLLTVPVALSVFGGRVDYGIDGLPNYLGKPKLKPKARWTDELTQTGVTLTDAVQHGGVLMIVTTVPYFLIQGPALFLHGPMEEVSAGEHYWALAGFILCVMGLIFYMRLQLKISQQNDDRSRRMVILKKQLQKGSMSLSGAVAAQVNQLAHRAASEYQASPNAESPLNTADPATATGDSLNPPPAVAAYLLELLGDGFRAYDEDKNGQLDEREVYVFFRDFNESISEEEMKDLFNRFDTDGNGFIDLNEFIGVAYLLIKLQDQKGHMPHHAEVERESLRHSTHLAANAFEAEEEEEIPEDLTHLPPDQQQAAIKKKAFSLLFAGSLLVLFFSDPMVDVLAAIASLLQVSPFYVSFILAPLASNSSELIASLYYASKKTRKTITVSLTALEGAACMNNTFCLSIFMGLIFFRGLAWQYTAETIAILLCQFVVGGIMQARQISLGKAGIIMALFPLSIGVVVALEAMGLD